MLRKTLAGMTLFAVLALFASGTYAQQEKNFDNYMPDDTIFYVSVDNLPGMINKLKNSSMGKLWNEPEFQAFLDKIAEFLQRNAETEMAQNLGITFHDIMELSELFSGQIALSVDSFDWKKVTEKKLKYDFENGELQYKEVEEEVDKPIPNIAVFCSVKDKAKVEEFVGKILAKAKENLAAGESGVELTIKAETYKTAQYTIVKNSKEPDVSVYYGFIQNIFFFSLNDKAFKRFADNYAAPEAAVSLFKNADYKKIIAECGGPRRDMTVFLNCISGGKFLEKAMDTYVGANPVLPGFDEAKPKVMKVLDMLGILSLKYIAGTVEITQDGMISSAYIYAPGPKKGIWKLLTAHKGPFQTLPVAPDDNMLFCAMHVSLAEFYDETLRIIKEVVEPETYTQVIAGIEGFQQSMQVNLRKDILGAMGSELAFAMDFKNFNFDSTELDMSEFLDFGMVCTLNNQPLFEQSLNKILSQSPVKPESKAYGKFMLKMIPSPVGSYCYCVTNGMVFFGSVNSVQKMLDASGDQSKSILSDSTYLNASNITSIGDNTIYFSFFDTKKYISTVYSNLKSAGMGMMFSEDQKEKEMLDLFKFMPSREVLLKYVSATVDAAYAVDAGILYKSFTPFTK